ncbi:MAG TPA: IclR family transcriptional regulator [Trinickia sp.]|jgi:DNA-binding IclR family transcriptional regulator|uniref:IclR family transcriptional regulator n=1 Tax=Trinickia sp. TaxID=2571163 RepID=UPI002BC2EB76|nr:IclR family transcriptional regulator [Trinickia sp.]HVW49796.1 IclR family transcriptional regulator [Trinickia sp.]
MAAETGTQAIDRAADLLVSVVESPRPLGVSELAARSGLPKSTTSRLLGALERRGLVQRAGDRRVVPGPVLLRFAHRDTSESLVELAAPALRVLSDISGETINLGVPTPLGVEHLSQIDSRHFVGGTNWVGRRVPYETSANGKVLRAFSAQRPVEGQPVRAQGYATTVDELERGLSALAAPVFGPESVAVAALSISGPSIRLTRERIAELAPALIEQARLVSERLGAPSTTQRGAA